MMKERVRVSLPIPLLYLSQSNFALWLSQSNFGLWSRGLSRALPGQPHPPGYKEPPGLWFGGSVP